MYRWFESLRYDPPDLAPLSLKYIRYRDLNEKSHMGKFIKSKVCYHRRAIVDDGIWWRDASESMAERVFENGNTPNFH